MNIIEETKMSITEALEFCISKNVEGAQGRLDSFTKNKKLATNQKVALVKDMECFYQNVTLTGGGKKGELILKDIKEEISSREDNRKSNGYKESSEEHVMKAIILNELVKGAGKIEGFEHGLSHAGWATFIGIPLVEESESFDRAAIEHLESCYDRKANEWFKPREIVNEFQRAYATIRKSVITNAFQSLEKEGQIETESFWIAGYADENRRDHVDFRPISEDKYKEMKATRSQILEQEGSDIGEYFAHIKKHKNDRMKRIFQAVEDGLMGEYGATRFHESIKVKLIGEHEVINLLPPIHSNFMRHFFSRSVTYRHNRNSYKTSTYFWRRFYLLNTCYLLEFTDKSTGIDQVMYDSLKESFSDDLKSYLYDFDTQFYYPREIAKEGFFGNITHESEKRHAKRMEEMIVKIELPFLLEGEDTTSTSKGIEMKQTEEVEDKKIDLAAICDEADDTVKAPPRTKKVVTIVEPSYVFNEQRKPISISKVIEQSEPLKGFGYELDQPVTTIKITPNKRIDKVEQLKKKHANREPRELINIGAL